MYFRYTFEIAVPQAELIQSRPRESLMRELKAKPYSPCISLLALVSRNYPGYNIALATKRCFLNFVIWVP